MKDETRKINGKNVMIVGCSRLGATLAGSLSSMGYNVTIVDEDKNSFLKLPDTYSGYEVSGDGTDVNILRENNIESMQMFICVTDSDNTNILAAKVAAEIFFVPEIYVRLTDDKQEELIDNSNVKVIYPFQLSLEEFKRISSVQVSDEMVEE